MVLLPRRRLVTGAAALAAFAALPRDAVAAVTPTTFNPADATATLSNGNLTVTYTSGGNNLGARTIFSTSTGKYYFEFWGSNLTSGGSYTSIGLSSAGVSFANIMNTGVGVFGWYAADHVYLKGSSVATIDAYTSSNTNSASACQVAIDFGGELAWFRNQSHGSNGNWNASSSANPATGAGGISFSTLGSPPWFVYSCLTPNNGTIVMTLNFGASAFNYAVPSGFQPGFGLISSGAGTLATMGVGE